MAKPDDLNLPEIPVSEAMTTQEYAYMRMRNAIMLGAVAPGTKLTIRGLATYLELSPTPVREAIRRLSSEHAVEILGNRRLTIPPMKAGRFEELILLRIALETHAAERALPYVSGIIIDELVRIDDHMDQSIEDQRTEDLTNFNHSFHRTLYAANPNQQVIPLIESIWLQLGPFQRQVVENVKSYYQIDRHKEILDALRNRDSMALVVAMENDIRDGIARSGREVLQNEAKASHAA